MLCDCEICPICLGTFDNCLQKGREFAVSQEGIQTLEANKDGLNLEELIEYQILEKEAA
jgi:hypothetical protein